MWHQITYFSLFLLWKIATYRNLIFSWIFHKKNNLMISNVRTPLGNNGGVPYGTVQYFLSLSNVTIPPPPLLVHHYHDSVYMAIDSKYDTLSLPRESVEVCPVESFGLPLIHALPHPYLGT